MILNYYLLTSETFDNIVIEAASAQLFFFGGGWGCGGVGVWGVGGGVFGTKDI